MIVRVHATEVYDEHTAEWFAASRCLPSIWLWPSTLLACLPTILRASLNGSGVNSSSGLILINEMNRRTGFDKILAGSSLIR